MTDHNYKKMSWTERLFERRKETQPGETVEPRVTETSSFRYQTEALCAVGYGICGAVTAPGIVASFTDVYQLEVGQYRIMGLLVGAGLGWLVGNKYKYSSTKWAYWVLWVCCGLWLLASLS
jgi:hypothetical protein